MVNRLADSTGKGAARTVKPAAPLLGGAAHNTTSGAAPWAPPMLAPQAAAAPPQVSGGGGSGGGGGAPMAAAVAAPAAAPPAPAPVRDIDWFNQDSVYRGAAGRSLSDLTGQLAQILSQRDQNYQTLDMNRQDVNDQRQDDLTDTGSDFASRGLLGSGLYADYADDVSSDYARQNSALDQTGSQIAQQYGQRGAKVNLAGANSQNGQADLSGLYGLLGSLGLQAGTNYNNAIGKAKADSAARSTAPLLQTTTW